MIWPQFWPECDSYKLWPLKLRLRVLSLFSTVKYEQNNSHQISNVHSLDFVPVRVIVRSSWLSSFRTRKLCWPWCKGRCLKITGKWAFCDISLFSFLHSNTHLALLLYLQEATTEKESLQTFWAQWLRVSSKKRNVENRLSCEPPKKLQGTKTKACPWLKYLVVRQRVQLVCLEPGPSRLARQIPCRPLGQTPSPPWLASTPPQWQELQAEAQESSWVSCTREEDADF